MSSLSAGILLWVIHGIVIGDLPVILANGVSFGLSALMIYLVIKIPVTDKQYSVCGGVMKTLGVPFNRFY